MPYRKHGDEWVYPPIAGALKTAGLYPIEEYIRRRQNTIAQYISNRPIYELCQEATPVPTDEQHESPPPTSRSYRWWTQPSMVQPPPDLTRYDNNDDTDSVGTSLAHQDMSPPDSPSSLRAASPPHAPPQRLHKPLTRVQRERTREAWASPELAAGRSNNISPRAFHSLRDGTWLQDEAIHRFLRLLVARDAFQASLIDAHRPSFVFTSFFMTQLLNMGDLDPTVQGSYSYSNIQRWSRRVPGQDVFALDKLFLPVNVNRSHWMVIVAFMQEQRIQAYDSAGATNTRFLQATLRYLADEHQRVHNRALPVRDWSLCESTPATPTQLNGYDCGVFTCAFIDCLLRNDTPTFSQEDMTQYRRWITLSLLENQLPIG